MSTQAHARVACEKLAHDYGRFADEWQADALAALFTPDGVFDRLGTRFEGRAAIAHFIANRSREVWQKHSGSAFTFTLAADGHSANGTLDLELQRGRIGDPQVQETLRARYHDRYTLTDEGWRIALREVRLVAE